ncbi:unnamed protein product [Sphagnum tenellum]
MCALGHPFPWFSATLTPSTARNSPPTWCSSSSGVRGEGQARVLRPADLLPRQQDGPRASRRRRLPSTPRSWQKGRRGGGRPARRSPPTIRGYVAHKGLYRG